MLEPYEWPELLEPEYHNSITTLTLCELHDNGIFDLFDGTWIWPKYSDEQDAKLRTKIYEHFKYRDISLTPFKLWRDEFLRTMREIMPKYIYLYRTLENNPDLIGASSEYYKSRNIYSDFPQTMLAGRNQDYASTGSDMEFERIRQADIIEIAKRLQDYDDIDLLICKEIDPMFSCILSMNLNAF